MRRNRVFQKRMPESTAQRSFNVLDLGLNVVDRSKVGGLGVAGDDKVLLAALGIARHENDEQAEIDRQKRQHDQRDRQIVGKFGVGAEDRPHHEGDEQDADVGFEVADPDRVGIAGDQVAKVDGGIAGTVAHSPSLNARTAVATTGPRWREGNNPKSSRARYFPKPERSVNHSLERAPAECGGRRSAQKIRAEPIASGRSKP